MGRSTGIVLMAPPSENKTAQTTMNTLLSACNSKQKVRAGHPPHSCCPHSCRGTASV